MMRRQHWSKCAQGAILAVFVVYITFSLFTVNITPDLEESNNNSQPDDKSGVDHSWKLLSVLRLPRSISSVDNKQDGSVLSSHEVTTTENRDELLKDNVIDSKNSIRKSKTRKTILDDIFISVKTSEKFHKSRLDVVIRTWFTLARDQTWFFTDSNDPFYQAKTGGHLINTNCSSSHHRKDLCCKMSVEFDSFMDSKKKWFCHFDDDNYVNIPRLEELLMQYDPMKEWYLGRTSIKEPLKIVTRDNSEQSEFWFATGGAGFCISRPLALKMLPIAGGGRFISVGERIGLPDDVTMGYIIEHMMKRKLTVIKKFHSHLESMKLIEHDDLYDQVTFSYNPYSKQNSNVINIDGFDTKIDPTRFLSLHCYLFPNFNFCLK
ncbi:Fringe glycosyltransferase [Nymphon striatum]|nr:Fringe glycosyltransferase [Nymphon striatum]